MHSYQIEIIEDVILEPVTLEEVKSKLRIDQDYAYNDEDLELLISSSRQLLENHLNVGFAPRELKVQFTSGNHELPLGPTISDDADIVVEDAKTGDVIDADKYHISGLNYKSISLGGCSSGFNFFYPISGGLPSIWSVNASVSQVSYNVMYETGYDIGKLPKALKDALLTQIDYTFKSEGSEQMNPLSPVALQKCSSYSRNLVIQ